MIHESPISSFLTFLNRQSDAGLNDLSILRDAPVKNWPRLLGAGATSYGVLHGMLTYAHEQFDRDPSLAVAITKYVTDHVDEMEPFTESMILVPFIKGAAWKEHANALYSVGRFADAAEAARTAISIFSSTPALGNDLAAANLVRAMSLHALGNTGDALQLATESVRLFAAHADSARYLVSVQVCGGILFDLEEYSAALDAYSVARSVAEEQGNQREYARMLNNIATCNVCLDNVETAERQLQQAFRLFQQQGMESEMLRTVAALTRITSRHGQLDRALLVCHSIYAELLNHGLTLSAAQVLVELTVVMTEVTGHGEYARDEGARLAAAFSEEVNAPENVRTAMAFLARRSADATSAGQLRAPLAYVQSFLRDVMYTPSKEFAMPT